MKAVKKKAVIIGAVIILALAAGVGGWYFSTVYNSYKSVFYPGTTLNKMDISGLTVDEVRTQLEKKAADYKLTISFKDEQYTITSSDIKMQYNEAVDIQTLKDQQNQVKYDETSEEELVLTADKLFTYDDAALKAVLNQCDSMDPSKMTAPENAKLVYDEEKQTFSLEDGEQGNTLDVKAVYTAVQDAIEHQKSEINAEDAGLYELAVLRTDSDNAQMILDEACKYLDISLKYVFNQNQEEIIDKKQIGPWIYVDDNQEIQFDRDKVQELVNTYAEKYTSNRVNMDFTTTGGSVISLKVPVSGETIDNNALFEDIVKCLEDKTSGDREVPYTENASKIGNNFGGNYIEVDLTNQKLYLYKGGSLVMSSNIVSGSVSEKHMTPTGVYQVYSMEKNVVLRGADYASPVTYWMPFNGGVGFHDATWRSSFGGTIYQYNGSHGCINMPYEKAKTLYNTINTGYYVVVYGGVTYVPGQSSGNESGSSEETKKETEKPTETKPTETKPTETKPTETNPPETKPTETDPPETKPIETDPPETNPPETKPVETDPPETDSPETNSSESGWTGIWP
ncbi:MAG: L,D-transpeptidase family protein [Coprococcus sp.]